ncbi:TrmH family RNA methyltransferase [Ilumatobacter sp.]|uniref:TrmH family RNA methyltransferase n=1 Tax=Ilumatobacter sp. TaxID=1967498 RepID=UPI003B5273FB
MAAVIIVDDPDDERFAQFRMNERGLASRSDKRDDAGAGRFLAEGVLVVGRALDAGCRPIAALVDPDRVPAVADRLDCPVYGGGERVRRIVSGLGMPQSVIALFHRPARPAALDLARRCDRLVVLEAVDNPANVGAIVRNAAGLGWDGILLDHTSADPLARRSLRVAMGTAFALAHARTSSLADDLRRLGDVELYALTPAADAVALEEIDAGRRAAILVGSERAGLSEELVALAIPVRITMAHGVDSLNAAAATAIACWALRPRRDGGRGDERTSTTDRAGIV